jgi:NAD-dependent SIR2 family protein deacetylase
MDASKNAEVLMIVGTSMQVSTGASIALTTKAKDIWIVDRSRKSIKI